jgi:hypothetical protein
VRFAYPTLREEREGWGTRRLVAGMDPKSVFLPVFTCRRQASLLKSETWATHLLRGRDFKAYSRMVSTGQVLLLIT